MLEDKGVNKKELKIAESLNYLITNKICRNNVFTMRSTKFRTEKLWSSDINNIFAAENEQLSMLYYKLLDHTKEKKVFNFDSANKLRNQLLSIKFGDEALLFNLSGRQVYP